MEKILRWLIQRVALIHEYILRYNDSNGLFFSDKQLHLIVMGILGMLIFFVFYGIFKQIEKSFKHSTMIFSFIFTLTNLVVISFTIEIGQRLSNTGVMDIMDILFGLWGFIVFFLTYLLILIILFFTKKYSLRNKITK